MDEIEVYTIDEHGQHVTRIIPGDPPATDHTIIDTAELAALRAELEQLRLTARVNYGLYRSAHEDAEQAEAEAARLRAGESEHPAAVGVTRTPAEWIHQWNRATAEQRLARVEQILADAATATRCQQADHDEGLRRLADTEQIVARIRHLADVYNHGANTSTDPATRTWAASITDDLNIALNGEMT